MISEKSRGKIRIFCIFLTFIAVLLLISIFISILFKNYRTNFNFFGMDTFIMVSSDKNIGKEVEQIFLDAENIYDFHDGASEVSKLNSYHTINASDELADNLKRISELNVKYGNGADVTVGSLTRLWNITGENPRIPEQNEIDTALAATGFENIKISGNKITLENNAVLDFGCVAKGIALDKTKELLDKENSRYSLITTGSSILVYGNKYGYQNIDIKSPEQQGNIGAVTLRGDCFISTSGGYERYAEIDGKRYCHIIDTKTGYPTETDLTTVTVFCDSGLESDFLSTLIFTGGTKEIEKHLNSDSYKIIAADKDKNLYISDGLDFELKDDSYKYKQ